MINQASGAQNIWKWTRTETIRSISTEEPGVWSSVHHASKTFKTKSQTWG